MFDPGDLRDLQISIGCRLKSTSQRQFVDRSFCAQGFQLNPIYANLLLQLSLHLHLFQNGHADMHAVFMIYRLDVPSLRHRHVPMLWLTFFSLSASCLACQSH